jgi:hypothetical protein
MGEITTTSDKSEILEFFQDRLDNLPQKGSDTVLEITNVAAAVEEVLSPVRTGQNRDETKVEVDGLEGVAWPDAPQALWIIGGTQPHEIRAVNAQALYWPGAMHPVKSVQHPGTAPNDYVADAFDQMDPGVDTALDELGSWVVDE